MRYHMTAVIHNNNTRQYTVINVLVLPGSTALDIYCQKYTGAFMDEQTFSKVGKIINI